MDNISNLIAKKRGHSSLLDDLSEKLSASELNSLLLELFRRRTKKITPAGLLSEFMKNRFAAPSAIDTIDFKEFEIRCLGLAKNGASPNHHPPTALVPARCGVGDQNTV
jgi:hypothetical protein